MRPFGIEFRPTLPMEANSPFGDIARSVWRGELGFSNMFQNLGAVDGNLDKLHELFKNASNLQFSTPDMNRVAGKEPHFFIDQLGKLTKNPNAQWKPGEPLNIEVQFNGNTPNDHQTSLMQKMLDVFRAAHPDIKGFPRTWQEAISFLQQLRAQRFQNHGGGRGTAYSGARGGPYGYGDGGGYGYGDGAGGGYGSDGGGFSQCFDTSVPPGARWDGQSRGDMNLLELSEDALGYALWKETEFAAVCQNGNLGCAASVSKILQAGGYNYGNSASVLELERQLTSSDKGWTVSGLEGVQPGAVILGDAGGGKQHIGIVGTDENGQLVIYNNHSSSGQWSKDLFNDCSIITDYSPGQIRVLHPPGSASTASV